MTRRLKLIRFSDVESTSINWLWPGVIPFGKLTLIVGDPGGSKSLLTIDIASRFTAYGQWPDGTPIPTLGTVIFLNAEDGPSDTQKPRFIAAGGDPHRATFLEATLFSEEGADREIDRPFSLQQDLDLLEEEIRQLGPTLVVLDPVTNYMAGKNTFKDAEVREALMPFAMMLERTGAAGVAVCHLNKTTASGAIYRVGGSIGFVGVARSVWGVGRDPDDPTSTRRLLTPIKSNLAPAQGSFAYSVKTAFNGQPILSWEEGRHDVDASAVFQQAQPQTRQRAAPQREDVEAWLSDLLSNGPVPAADVWSKAEADGHSQATVRRAKRALNVESIKSGLDHWDWCLPTRTPSPLPASSEGDGFN